MTMCGGVSRLAISLSLAAGACAAEPRLGTYAEAIGPICVDGGDGTYACLLLAFQPDPADWWQDTGIAVTSGDELAIECTGGTAAPWGGHGGFPCAGQSPPLLWPDAIATQCNFGSLVGRIGTSGTPFCIGDSGSAIAPATGTLYLGFNDGVSFADNAGSWQIEVVPQLGCGGLTARGECPLPCGNGTVEELEQCDDGNRTNGDGCSSTCLWETCVEISDAIGHSFTQISGFSVGITGACEAAIIGGSPVDATALAEQVALEPPGSGATYDHQEHAACAILNEALRLCNDGSYHQDGEPLVTRTALCHPGVEIGCTRHVPDFGEILTNAGLPGSSASVTAPHSYCSGQVTGSTGYALEVPQDPIDWTCTAAEAAELTANAGDVLGALGWPNWPSTYTSCDGGNAGSVSCNRCRLGRAVRECVLPNLGAASSCTVPGMPNTGVSYAAIGDTCFDIVQFTGGADGSPHAAGRAFDLNNNPGTMGPQNNGNLFASQGNKVMNVPLTPQLDLPPAFVSIMEGCGFTWGGRWWNAETVLLACDPMHFELP